MQHPPGWCDDSHSAPERPPHTSLLVERRQSDEANQCMGMIRRPWWSEASGLVWPGCRGNTPKMITHGYWRYIEVLWIAMNGLCKKQNVSYNIINCNPRSGVMSSLQTNHYFEPIFLVNYAERKRKMILNFNIFTTNKDAAFIVFITFSHWQSPDLESGAQRALWCGGVTNRARRDR